MVTLHGAMGYGAMVLHDAENCNKVMAPCDHGVLAYGDMQYNHGGLELDAVQKTDPIHFVFKFQKKVNLSHFDPGLPPRGFLPHRSKPTSSSQANAACDSRPR
jgi:hypothetical protein